MSSELLLWLLKVFFILFYFFILLLNLEFRTINQASRTGVDFLRALLCLFVVLCCLKIISHLISFEPYTGVCLQLLQCK